MRVLLSIIGYSLVGGVGGYITGRWKLAYIVLLGVLGLSLIADPQMPGLVGQGDSGSWPETIAFVAGVIIGGRMGERDRERATVDA